MKHKLITPQLNIESHHIDFWELDWIGLFKRFYTWNQFAITIFKILRRIPHHNRMTLRRDEICGGHIHEGTSEGKGAEVISLIHASVQDVAKEKNSGENDKVVYLWKTRCKNRRQSILRILLPRVSR
jgi:hypothetical protein